MIKYPFATTFIVLTALSYWFWMFADPTSATFFLRIMVTFVPFLLPIVAVVGLIAWLAKRAEKKWPKDLRP